MWLDPSTFENLDSIFHTLFDDFCDADHPEGYLAIILRTEEEVSLMRQLGALLNAATAEAPNDADAEYLQASAWPEVVAVAGRLAQVMVANDLRELATSWEARPTGEPPREKRSQPLASGPRLGFKMPWPIRYR
ncbi:SCO4402 family protein [Streptomyces sp. DT193]|uniref:SCO4402 family protein n=1 Tax=Streptomyces sp. DT193 TaxID=3393418 RepID=UPI003CED69D3